MTCLRKYYICMLCDSTDIYQYIYMYFFVAVIFDSHMYCINVIYNIFFYILTISCHLLLCELLPTTVWNIPMLCHIHNINRKFQVIVKLLIFIIEISLTYLNK